jgi:hypothetical protein
MRTATRSAIGLPERNLLLGGEPGAGKSAGLSLRLNGDGMATPAKPSCRFQGSRR